MKEILINYGPWGLSCITVILTMLQGDKYKYAWLLTLINQALWLTWILLSKTYGFLPLNIAMWIMCFRNHFKWVKEGRT
jgi:hypothetical protein